jgi:hypothetical protein
MKPLVPLMIVLSLCAPALADEAEVKRFLQPGEELVRHVLTRSGNDVGITSRRLLVVAKKNLVEAHFLDDITHGLVHERGVSLRLNTGRILGLTLPMPASAGAIVDLARGASSAEFQLQTGNRARLRPGFTASEIARALPPSAVIPAPIKPVKDEEQGGIAPGPTPPPPAATTSPVDLINPVYLHLDLGAVSGLSAHIQLREQFEQVKLTLLPDDARLFASATVEKIQAADTRGTLLGKTKMKSYSVVVLVKVGNRNGDVYAADRVSAQVLGISEDHALKSAIKKKRRGLTNLIEGAIINYANVRHETGSPFVLTKPFDAKR